MADQRGMGAFSECDWAEKNENWDSLAGPLPSSSSQPENSPSLISSINKTISSIQRVVE
jgi:hypothetical protein